MLPVFMILRCKIYFMRAPARNTASCALPRVTLHSRKIDFIESVTSSSLHSITGEARMTRLPTEKIRGFMSKMCALAEDIGDFRRFSISFTGKRSSCPPRLVSMQNFLANRFCPLKRKNGSVRREMRRQSRFSFKIYLMSMGPTVLMLPAPMVSTRSFGPAFARM